MRPRARKNPFQRHSTTATFSVVVGKSSFVIEGGEARDPFGQKFRIEFPEFPTVKWNRKFPVIPTLREVAQIFRNERSENYCSIWFPKWLVPQEISGISDISLKWKTSKWTFRKRLFHLILDRKCRNFFPNRSRQKCITPRGQVNCF